MIINLAIALWLSISGMSAANETPDFKGGQKALSSFIKNNLIYPEYSKQNCLQGTVQVSFQLNKEGRVFNSKVHKGYGTDLDTEALRIIRLSTGRWFVPAAFDTSQAIIIPINFTLTNFDCNERSADDINAAIAAYRAREDLTRAVINFYNKKSTANYSSADEAHILELKAQLGYNDKYFDKLIRQAQQKLKQGDKQGACEDFSLVKQLGSDRADKYLEINCR